MAKTTPALTRETPWRYVIILCRKCTKKLDGGFGPDQDGSLKATLRQALRDINRRRDVRVLETSCLGICPKRGVTAFNATAPGTIHVVPAGSNGQDVLRTLRLGPAMIATDYGVKEAWDLC